MDNSISCFSFLADLSPSPPCLRGAVILPPPGPVGTEGVVWLRETRCGLATRDYFLTSPVTSVGFEPSSSDNDDDDDKSLSTL